MRRRSNGIGAKPACLHKVRKTWTVSFTPMLSAGTRTAVQLLPCLVSLSVPCTLGYVLYCCMVTNLCDGISSKLTVDGWRNQTASESVWFGPWLAPCFLQHHYESKSFKPCTMLKLCCSNFAAPPFATACCSLLHPRRRTRAAPLSSAPPSTTPPPATTTLSGPSPRT